MIFQIAIICLAVIVGGLAMLGAAVVIKVFLAAMELKRRLGAIPNELARRQQALNDAQARIVLAQKKLAEDRAALPKQ